MNGLAFVAEMTRALAWPLAVVVLVFVFRAQIRERIPFLRTVKAGPLEATLGEEAAGIRRAAQAATDAPAVAEVAAALGDELSARLAEAIERDEETRRDEIEDAVRYAVGYGHLLGTIIPPGEPLPEVFTAWTEDGRFLIDVEDLQVSSRMRHPSRAWLLQRWGGVR